MYGWTGKILKINLSNKKFEFVYPDKSLYEKYIGGRGWLDTISNLLSPKVTTTLIWPGYFMTGPP